jgi:hypothetical protein
MTTDADRIARVAIEYADLWKLCLDEQHRAERAEAQLAECRRVLQDMADNGLRYDLNPTHDMSDLDSAETFWHSYMRKADTEIRRRAKAAIDAALSARE